MDVLEFLDSIWGNGVPTYYWDGPELNPYVGLFENDSLGGWMLAERNIRGRAADEIVAEAAETIREKKADVEQRRAELIVPRGQGGAPPCRARPTARRPVLSEPC